MELHIHRTELGKLAKLPRRSLEVLKMLLFYTDYPAPRDLRRVMRRERAGEERKEVPPRGRELRIN